MSMLIKDYSYTEFINRLSIDIIRALNHNAIQIAKHMRITKPQMISLFSQLFSPFPMFPLIYEQIFFRFHKAKCNVFSNQSSYFIRTITSDDEIDIYELCVALTIFVKCEFIDKIHFLFDLTDSDDDGFINEIEMRKMISTPLILFSNNINSIETKSTVLNQSLAYLDANTTIDMLLKYPGKLKQKFIKDKYISFELFYDRLSLIPGYKAELLPFYVNFKDCLCFTPNEMSISLSPSNLSHYVSISNEIINPPLSPNKKEKTTDIRPQPQMRKIVKKRFVALKFKRDEERKKVTALNQMSSMTNKRNCNLKEFRVSYMKIRSIEAKPGRLHLLESRNCSLPNILYNKSNEKKKGSDYKNVEELISEINMIAKANRKEDYSSLEMNKIETKVNELGSYTRKFLGRKDSNLHLNRLTKVYSP